MSAILAVLSRSVSGVTGNLNLRFSRSPPSVVTPVKGFFGIVTPGIVTAGSLARITSSDSGMVASKRFVSSYNDHSDSHLGEMDRTISAQAALVEPIPIKIWR